HVASYISCSPAHRLLIAYWVACLYLLDFVGVWPHLRLQSSSASGKTWGTKAITTALTGVSQHEQTTLAAIRSLASSSPLLGIDNLENSNATPEFIDFLLCLATGAARTKRRSGTDSEVIRERPKCLILSNGIEPIGAHLEEFLNRTFVVELRPEFKRDAFPEGRTLSRIIEARDRIMSALMKRTSMMLARIRDGHLEMAMLAIRRGLGHHAKERCDE